MILPGRLVPKSRISICTTPVCWQTHTWCLREDSRKLRGDFVVQCFARCVGRNLDVVAGARKLELVNRSRAQGGCQLECETMAGLIPVRADRREPGISPEVAARVQVRPGLIRILDQQIHLLGDVDVTANTVLA